MRLSHSMIGCVALLAGCAAARREAAMNPDVFHPKATGLLIVSVAPETQAAELGVERWDILLSYGGTATPSLDALNKAKAAAERAKREAVPAEICRDGRTLTFELKPGMLGVNTVPVLKDTPLVLRPPATGVEFDFSRLKDAPLDDWYSFHIEGRHVGFEHAVLALKDGRLELTREVAFDFGEEWGIQHFLVTVTATAGPQPRALSCRYEVPGGDFVCDGRLVTDDAGARWESTLTWTEKEGDKEGDKEDGKEIEKREVKRIASPPADLMPSYLVGELAAFMPREPGACFHYTMLTDARGELENPGALCAANEEEVDVGGESVRAMRFECRSMGGTGNVTWVDASGRMVKHFYGGAEAQLTTRESALAGLKAEIAPRTAGPAPRR